MNDTQKLKYVMFELKKRGLYPLPKEEDQDVKAYKTICATLKIKPVL